MQRFERCRASGRSGICSRPTSRAFGPTRLVNVIATAPLPGQHRPSRQTIVIMAHRDNSGLSPGANDNALGHRGAPRARPRHRRTSIPHTGRVHLDDGGALRLAGRRGVRRRIRRLARPRRQRVVNLDAIASPAHPRLRFAGDDRRIAHGDARRHRGISDRGQAGAAPPRPSAFAQLVDLAFPVHAPRARAPSSRAGSRRSRSRRAGRGRTRSRGDTVETLAPARLGAARPRRRRILLVASTAAELARGPSPTSSSAPPHPRLDDPAPPARRRSIPFLAATIDLFARCRRRHIPLRPALRSLLSRLGSGSGSAPSSLFFSRHRHASPDGDARPIAPGPRRRGRLAGGRLLVLLGLSLLGWLVVRPRLVPGRQRHAPRGARRPPRRHARAGLVALVVAARTPSRSSSSCPRCTRGSGSRTSTVDAAWALGVYALGFLGPLILLGSFALRLDIGLDALWYLSRSTSVGYVTPSLVVAGVRRGARRPARSARSHSAGTRRIPVGRSARSAARSARPSAR